ncbi:hypothetical protein O9H85_27150 [Paenibacillus filicis]|uniref:Uncharacterized protein n=1 Tax=Paenibacillus gyeongsangnamensis TaxID=3388067 RepID=A0ABT4QGT3_9BACL|nr:hypothetical protein [Paenibacillus filicis]MCZ8516013.1 hypothetical protein [Paenibacillus filicis]
MIPFIIICAAGLSIFWLLSPSTASKRDVEPIALNLLDRVESELQEASQPAIAHK